MTRHVSYTAAYAELSRYILQGIRALQRRDTPAAVQAFSHAVQLSATAVLGAQALVGSKRNLAIALKADGRLNQAETILRELLTDPDLPADEQPSVRHELGSVLALAGRPEAADHLSRALALYPDRQDTLLCAVDLGQFWLALGEYQRGYHALSEIVNPEDQTRHPDVFGHLHVILARLALGANQAHLAQAHLEQAGCALQLAGRPILQSLHLAVLADLEFRKGNRAGARAHARSALENGLAQADLDTSDVFRTIAGLFHRIVTE